MLTLGQIAAEVLHLIDQLALSWRSGDSLLLLGTTVAFIDWLKAYLTENQIDGIASLYVLADDIAQLGDNTIAKLALDTKIDEVLSDTDWVNLTQDSQFDKVVTIAL